MAAQSFDQIPGGLSGVQTRLGLLFNEGVRRRRISLTRLVAVTATNPARLFGLWPRKGTIDIGSDADLVLFDPERRLTIGAGSMESASDFDPFEGYQAVGWPATTLARGRVVFREGRLEGSPGRGVLVARDRFPVRREKADASALLP
jgi:dihydropyrimidinase